MSKPTVIDLFAGAGGLSLGAARAGFNVIAAFENNPKAAETHRKNFPSTLLYEQDITSDKLFDDIDALGQEISGIIGGPPCQGFSYMGHRELADDRNNLFVRFFECIKTISPGFFVAENVMGILSPKYDQLRNNAFSLISDEYKQLTPLIVKADEYGAPTTRTRVFFIGWKKTMNITLTEDDFKRESENCQKVHVAEALRGLPERIHCSQANTGSRKVDPTFFQWVEENKNPFFERVVGMIPQGVGDHATIDKYLQNETVTACYATRHTNTVRQRFKTIKVGERDFVSKAMRLDPEGFCPTLRAGTGPDRGSYQAVRPIHYSQHRVITAREAARLQGFPDWFALPQTIWHCFRQIGNSVSPLVAERVLSVIYRTIERVDNERNS